MHAVNHPFSTAFTAITPPPWFIQRVTPRLLYEIAPSPFDGGQFGRAIRVRESNCSFTPQLVCFPVRQVALPTVATSIAAPIATRHLTAKLHELERGTSTQRLGSQSQTYSAWEYPSYGCTELSTSAGSSLPGISSVSISAEFGTPTIPRARAHSIIALRSAEVNPRRS